VHPKPNSLLPPTIAGKIALAAIIVDNHWDNFRHAFKLPARSVDGLLLVGFAHVGMYALLLITLILLIEITDWLRAR